jgi:hypothetical protein
MRKRLLKERVADARQDAERDGRIIDEAVLADCYQLIEDATNLAKTVMALSIAKEVLHVAAEEDCYTNPETFDAT